MPHGTPRESRCYQDKHKAPHPPHVRPLSLQDVGCSQYPIWSAKFIRGKESASVSTELYQPNEVITENVRSRPTGRRGAPIP